MHIYLCICVHVYMYIYVCVYVYMLYVYMYMCIYVWISVYVYICTFSCICMYMDNVYIERETVGKIRELPNYTSINSFQDTAYTPYLSFQIYTLSLIPNMYIYMFIYIYIYCIINNSSFLKNQLYLLHLLLK